MSLPPRSWRVPLVVVAGWRSCSPVRGVSVWVWGGSLYGSEPVYAAAFDAVCAALDAFLPHAVASVVFAGAESAEAALLDQTRYTQAALFAVETALYRLVESSGLRAGLSVRSFDR